MIIAFTAQKGGTGKTSTLRAVADILGNKKKKVLCVDMDGQCNLTMSTNTDPASNEDGFTVIDLLNQTTQPDKIIKHSKYYDLIAGDEHIYNLEHMNPETTGIDWNMLYNVLDPLQNIYTYILIDTGPTLGNTVKLALASSDYTVICTRAGDPYSISGAVNVFSTVEAVKEINNRLNVAGVLITQYDNRTRAAKEIRDYIKKTCEEYNIRAFNTLIRMSTAVQLSTGECAPLVDLYPRNNATIDYIEFTKELERVVKL